MIDDKGAPGLGANLDVRPSRRRGDGTRRYPLLPSVIALLSALVVLTVFGFGRVPSRVRDQGSVASAPEHSRVVEPPVPTTGSSRPPG
jgi:hypothetical protein